jgi:SAM-dependent methyltransferase
MHRVGTLVVKRSTKIQHSLVEKAQVVNNKTYGDLVFFTITARNYIPYAKVLCKSLQDQMPGSKFYLAICDDEGDVADTKLGFPTISLNDLDEDRIFEMAERYNITEFCTAIKPFVFRNLYERFPGKSVCYIDPDILAVSPFTELISALEDGANLVLTPHVLEPSRHEQAPDQTMLKFGVYNLGFLGSRATPESDALMAWWCDRLEHECIIDIAEGLFVDQKWADMFPSLIDNVHILRHPGYNVAYWNLLQRQISFDGNEWLSNEKPLRFVHFSGNEMTKPGVFSRHGWYIDYKTLGDLKLLYERYRELIIQAGYFDFAKQRYAFNFDGAAGINLHTPTNTADALTRQISEVNRPLALFDNSAMSEIASNRMHSGTSELLYVKPIFSWDDYKKFRTKEAPALERQRSIEKAAEGVNREWFDVRATCSMCSNVSDMRVSYMYAHTMPDGTIVPNWREHLDCKCGFINRIRAAMHLVQTVVQPKDTADIYVTERVTQLYKWLKIRYPKTRGSEFLGPHYKPGEIVNGLQHEDVCKLSFANEQFDLMMSFDVLEHVEHFDRALFELYRCLKPGGTLVFAAPTQLDRAEVVDRVLVNPDGSYNYLTEPEYHGNPVDAENGALCFRYLGLDVLKTLRKLGFSEAKALFYWSKDYGYLGENQLLFYAQK